MSNKINIQALRTILVTCNRMGPLFEGFTIMEVASHPVMPLSDWTETERMEALAWAMGQGAASKVPSAIARHLAAIGGGE